MEEILAFTVIAELPHDLGLDNVGLFAFDRGAEPWDGWDTQAIAGLVGYTRPLDAGRTPTYRVMLRRTRVRNRPPLMAADKLFADWAEKLQPPWRRIMRRAVYRVASVVGLHEFMTAAAITAFLPTRHLPVDAGPAWTEHRVLLALQVLNDFLVALGIEANDPRIGPVYRSDLPPLVPVIVETQPVPTPKRQGGDWLAPLHDWFPAHARSLREHDEVERAASLFRAEREKETPWFPVLELTHTARRDGMAGRYSSSVLSAGTAIEMLLSTVITEAGRTRGWSQEKIDGILASGLKNILVAQIPKALQVSIDIDDDSTPWGAWWRRGYAMRNAVAHHGHRPTEEEAHAAIYAAMELVAEVGRIVDADPNLTHLGLGLPTGVGA